MQKYEQKIHTNRCHRKHYHAASRVVY